MAGEVKGRLSFIRRLIGHSHVQTKSQTILPTQLDSRLPAPKGKKLIQFFVSQSQKQEQLRQPCKPQEQRKNGALLERSSSLENMWNLIKNGGKREKYNILGKGPSVNIKGSTSFWKTNAEGYFSAAVLLDGKKVEKQQPLTKKMSTAAAPINATTNVLKNFVSTESKDEDETAGALLMEVLEDSKQSSSCMNETIYPKRILASRLIKDVSHNYSSLPEASNVNLNMFQNTRRDDRSDPTNTRFTIPGWQFPPSFKAPQQAPGTFSHISSYLLNANINKKVKNSVTRTNFGTSGLQSQIESIIGMRGGVHTPTMFPSDEEEIENKMKAKPFGPKVPNNLLLKTKLPPTPTRSLPLPRQTRSRSLSVKQNIYTNNTNLKRQYSPACLYAGSCQNQLNNFTRALNNKDISTSHSRYIPTESPRSGMNNYFTENSINAGIGQYQRSANTRTSASQRCGISSCIRTCPRVPNLQRPTHELRHLEMLLGVQKPQDGLDNSCVDTQTLQSSNSSDYEWNPDTKILGYTRGEVGCFYSPESTRDLENGIKIQSQARYSIKENWMPKDQQSSSISAGNEDNMKKNGTNNHNKIYDECGCVLNNQKHTKHKHFFLVHKEGIQGRLNDGDSGNVSDDVFSTRTSQTTSWDEDTAESGSGKLDCRGGDVGASGDSRAVIDISCGDVGCSGEDDCACDGFGDGGCVKSSDWHTDTGTLTLPAAAFQNVYRNRISRQQSKKNGSKTFEHKVKYRHSKQQQRSHQTPKQQQQRKKLEQQRQQIQQQTQPQQQAQHQQQQTQLQKQAQFEPQKQLEKRQKKQTQQQTQLQHQQQPQQQQQPEQQKQQQGQQKNQVHERQKKTFKATPVQRKAFLKGRASLRIFLWSRNKKGYINCSTRSEVETHSRHNFMNAQNNMQLYIGAYRRLMHAREHNERQLLQEHMHNQPLQRQPLLEQRHQNQLLQQHPQQQQKQKPQQQQRLLHQNDNKCVLGKIYGCDTIIASPKPMDSGVYIEQNLMLKISSNKTVYTPEHTQNAHALKTACMDFLKSKPLCVNENPSSLPSTAPCSPSPRYVKTVYINTNI